MKEILTHIMDFLRRSDPKSLEVQELKFKIETIMRKSIIRWLVECRFRGNVFYWTGSSWLPSAWDALWFPTQQSAVDISSFIEARTKKCEITLLPKMDGSEKISIVEHGFDFND